MDLSEGIVWKNLRKNMSPTFTSGKLKGMMEPMTEVIDRFMGQLEKMAEDGKEVEVKPILQGQCKCYNPQSELRSTKFHP